MCPAKQLMEAGKVGVMSCGRWLARAPCKKTRNFDLPLTISRMFPEPVVLQASLARAMDPRQRCCGPLSMIKLEIPRILSDPSPSCGRRGCLVHASGSIFALPSSRHADTTISGSENGSSSVTMSFLMSGTQFRP